MELAESCDQTKNLSHLSYMSILPTELLLAIFNHLPIPTLIQATSVCTRWNQIIFTLIHRRIRCRISNDLDLIEQLPPIRPYGTVSVNCSTLSLTTPTLILLCHRATDLEIHVNLLHESVLAELLPQCPWLERLTVRTKCLVVEGSWKTVELAGRFPTIESVSVIAESFFSPEQKSSVYSGEQRGKGRRSKVKNCIGNGLFYCWKKLRKLIMN